MYRDVVESLERYVADGVPVGSFLQAVLENNLMEAMGRADSDNRLALFAICEYVHNHLPATCHGSPERYETWIETARRKREGKETVNERL